jgi:AAA+ ATPase superfamily predicted ATPase
LDQHPEYPIIIPTTFAQILDRGKHSLKEAVRRNFILRDLFGYQNPLKEETFFFGRQSVVSSVLDLAKSGQSSSLFGLRKSGKTSAIYAIQRKAKGHLINVAVIDCQNPAVHARRYDSLLSYLVNEVRRSSGQKKALPDLGEKIETISENFFIQMNSTLGASKNNVLLIFDEIENISPRTAASQHWREGKDTLLFWQIVRSYIQSEARGRLSVCLVGTSPRILEIPKINDIANPIYLFAQKQFIPSLSFDETREMVERLGYFMGFGISYFDRQRAA